jgi:phage terminase large subunit
MDNEIVVSRAFKEFIGNKHRYSISYGGAGSGKSYSTAQKLILRTLQEDGHRILVVRKVARTLRHSVFALFRDIISEAGLEKCFTINKSDMLITCYNGNQIIFAGLDDVEKLKSIQGITGIWIEEASEIAETDFTQLDLRLRGETKNYKQIVLTFNPISSLSWIKRRFFDTKDERARILKTTYRDNPFIDEEYKQVIENLKDQDYVYYQVYALGEWGVLGNLVLTNWTVADFDTKQFDSVNNGLDFGFTDPSAFLRIALKDDELYFFGEYYERGRTNNELIADLGGFIEEIIVADSAEPARIEEFRQAGFRNITGAAKGPDSVKAGIDWLRRHKIHIHSSCINTINEIQGWKYREDKDGNVFEEPVGINDHLMSAARYAVEPLRRDIGPATVRTLKKGFR